MSKPVRGDVQDATEEGFARLLARANEVYGEGLVLIGIVNLGQKKIGGVFVKMPRQPTSAGASLIGE